MTIDVETPPLDSGPPLANSGLRSASTGVPAGSGPTAVGSTSPVRISVNFASPLYLICLRVIQCPPMLSRLLTLRMPPKLTAKPLPVADSDASARSAPVSTPSGPNVVPADAQPVVDLENAAEIDRKAA